MIGVSAYLYAVASVKFGLDGAELAVDAGILGMKTYFIMYFKGEVEGCGTLRHVD